jgi:hypothetical protein
MPEVRASETQGQERGFRLAASELRLDFAAKEPHVRSAVPGQKEEQREA